MVFGMAGCMSIYGLVSGYIHNGFYANSVILDYLSVFSKNVIFALPSNGPIISICKGNANITFFENTLR